MILNRIVQASALRAASLPIPDQASAPESRAGIADLNRPRSLIGAITGSSGRSAIIAEMKPASPSKGHLRTITNPVSVARDLVAGGCCALSVITEPEFFHGTVAAIPAIRAGVGDIPILRKDFIVDLRQIDETRRLGADAVLLIAAVLGDRLPEFVDAACRRGLEPLVEVHCRSEIRSALDTRAELIGVNNRDLKTLRTDISTTCRLAPLLRDAGRTVVAESGITWPCDIRTLRPHARGFLIGSSIMAAGNPQKRLEGFVYA